MVLEQDVHAIVTADCRNVCVCVCGVIDEKGRENGREKRTPKNTIKSEAGRLLSTSLHAVAQRSKVHVFLDGLGYLLLLQYL